MWNSFIVLVEADRQVASSSSESHRTRCFTACASPARRIFTYPTQNFSSFLHNYHNVNHLSQTKSSTPGSAALIFHGARCQPDCYSYGKRWLRSPVDRGTLIRAAEAMQVHSPNKAACSEVVRAIVSKYPVTFVSKSGEGEQLGCGYYSLL